MPIPRGNVFFMDEDVSTEDGAITCHEISTLEMARLAWSGISAVKRLAEVLPS